MVGVVDVQPVAGNVLFDVWLAARAATARLDSALVESGLSADEFAIYSVLRKGPLTPSNLAGWMSAPATTVSSYLRRFERRGHLSRHDNPADGRSYLIGLSPAGVRAFEAAGAAFLPVLGEVEEQLGPNRSEIEQMLLRLREALVHRPPDE